MDALSLLAWLFAGVAATVGLLHTLLEIREKLWPKRAETHPLAAPLADIAAAIRATRPPAEPLA